MTLDVRSGSSTGFRLDPVPPAVAPVDDEPRGFHGRLTVDGVGEPSATWHLVRADTERRLPVEADGSFDVGPLAPGLIELVLRLGSVDGVVELWRASVDVTADPEPLRIDVVTAPLSAQLSEPTGERAPGVVVVLRGVTATNPPGRVELVLTADSLGFVSFDRLPAGSYTMHITEPGRGWLRNDDLRVGRGSVALGMSVRLERLIRVAGGLTDVGIDVVAGSEIDLVRAAPDGVELRIVAVCREGGGFAVDGLLPGRYRAKLRAALRQGRFWIRPEHSGVVIPLADFIVPNGDVSNAVLRAR